MSLRKGDDIIAGGNTVKIESTLNPNSVNPVQNKAVAEAINAINTTLENLDCGTMS